MPTLRETTFKWDITENCNKCFENQFVFEAKQEETYTEVTHYYIYICGGTMGICCRKHILEKDNTTIMICGIVFSKQSRLEEILSCLLTAKAIKITHRKMFVS